MDRFHCLNCSFASYFLIFLVFYIDFSMLPFFIICSINSLFHFHFNLLMVTTQTCWLMRWRLLYCKFRTTYWLFPRWILVSSVTLCCLCPYTSSSRRVTPSKSLNSRFCTHLLACFLLLFRLPLLLTPKVFWDLVVFDRVRIAKI